jgi:hypothetical protein
VVRGSRHGGCRSRRSVVHAAGRPFNPRFGRAGTARGRRPTELDTASARGRSPLLGPVRRGPLVESIAIGGAGRRRGADRDRPGTSPRNHFPPRPRRRRTTHGSRPPDCAGRTNGAGADERPNLERAWPSDPAGHTPTHTLTESHDPINTTILATGWWIGPVESSLGHSGRSRSATLRLVAERHFRARSAYPVSACSREQEGSSGLRPVGWSRLLTGSWSVSTGSPGSSAASSQLQYARQLCAAAYEERSSAEVLAHRDG